jgi:hypothetical protein
MRQIASFSAGLFGWRMRSTDIDRFRVRIGRIHPAHE